MVKKEENWISKNLSTLKKHKSFLLFFQHKYALHVLFCYFILPFFKGLNNVEIARWERMFEVFLLFEESWLNEENQENSCFSKFPSNFETAKHHKYRKYSLLLKSLEGM